MRALFVLLLSLLGNTSAASAYRAEFVFEHKGERLAGSEACFHKLYDADHPLGRFFYYPDVTCLPADSILEVPPGLWDVHLRHRNGFVSAHPTTLVYRGKALPDQLYKKIHVTAYPAGLLSLSSLRKKSAEKRRIVLYMPTTHNAYPISDDTDQVMVPAGFPVVPLIVENKKPVSMARPVTLRENERITATEWSPAQGRMTVISWIHVPPAHAKQIGGRATPLATYIASDGTSAEPLFSPSSVSRLSERLLIFPDVPRGVGTLRVDGPLWVPDQVTVTPHPTHDVVFAARPLETSPSAEVILRWTVPQVSLSKCGEENTDSARVPDRRALLFKCDSFDTPREDTKTRCQMMRSEDLPLDQRAGEVRFERITPGDYRAALEVEGLGMTTTDVVANALSVVRVEVEPAPFIVFGRVSRNGKPVGGRLSFQTGSAVADETSGRYTALLQRSPGRSPIHLVNCSGEPLTVVIPKDRLQHQQPFDIDLSDSELKVTTVDERASPVPGAAITYRVLNESDGSIIVHSESAESDSDGVAIFRDVPARQRLQLCGSLRQRSAACTDTFEVRNGARSQIQLTLPDDRAREGRVEFPAPIMGGMLYWALPDGTEITQARITPDGSFVVSADIPPEARVYLVGRGIPLMRMSRADDEGQLRLRAPPGRDRSFTMSAPAEESTSRSFFFRVAIGGTVIPGPALTYHQFNNRSQATLRSGGSIVVAPIRTSEPLSVLFVASDDIDVLPGLRPQDVFLRPDLRHFIQRQVVPANDQVILPTKTST